MSKVTRRRYTPEFKAEAVALVEKQGYKISEAVSRSTVPEGIGRGDDHAG